MLVIKRAYRGAAPIRDAKVLAAMPSIVGDHRRRAALGGRGRARTAVPPSVYGAHGLCPARLTARRYHGVEHKAIAGYEQDTDAAIVPRSTTAAGSNSVARDSVDGSRATARALRPACAGRWPALWSRWRESRCP